MLTQKSTRIQQGDIIKDFEYKYIGVGDGNTTDPSYKLTFPYLIVLTQDCDLEQDFKSRINHRDDQNHDKWLFSILVAPLYPYEQFRIGDHLSDYGRKMRTFSNSSSATEIKNLRNNETPRYQYLDFGEETPIPDSVIDFKHFFTVERDVIYKHWETHCDVSLRVPFRERILQRFTNYISRIGLP